MTYKKWRWAANGLALACIIPAFLGANSQQPWTQPATYVAIVLFAGAVVVHALKFRSLHCRRHLPVRSPYDMASCPFCGKELE